MIKIIKSLLLLLSIVLFYSCKKEKSDPVCITPQITTVTDNDGNSYPVSQIVGRLWQAENLNSCKFKNGDLIEEAKTYLEWQQAIANQEPRWCYYDYDSILGLTYGKMYNVFAINDTRDLAPNGWHVSTKNDWQLIIDNFDINGFPTAAYHLKTTDGWLYGANGSDSLNFHAKPGGFWSDNSANSVEMGHFGWFWTSKEFAGGLNYNVALNDLNNGINVIATSTINHANGYYVRLVRD